MIKKRPAKELLLQLQGFLNEIASTGPDQQARFLYLKKRAARVLRRLKADYPEITSLPFTQGQDRRGPDSAQADVVTPAN